MSGMPAVFFDRDGTLMEDVHYCGDPARVKIYPGVPESLQNLKSAGYRTFIISNQSGIGRGLITEEQYYAVQQELLRQLGPRNIDASYFCPDPPGVPSARRKPEPGMVFEAVRDFAIDLAGSYFVGDKCSDVECGKRAGTHTILVESGSPDRGECSPDHTVSQTAQAAEFILAAKRLA